MGPRERPDLMRELIQQLFPRLNTSSFEITSARDHRYNCVAWAAGDTRRWWWPAEAAFSFWPAGVEREESIAGFVRAFGTLGYELTSSGDPHPDFEKLAIFASGDGVPTHMARQLPNGPWTSKLGALEDITHMDVTGLAGTDYGDVTVFLQRRRSS
jgi:hypothetical protein